MKSSGTRKKKNRAAHAFRLAALSLMRSNGYLGAYMRRQRSRLGAPKMISAAAHKLARIVYSLVRFGGEYVKQSQDEYEALNRERMERSLRKRAKDLGYEVVNKPEPAEQTEAEACDTPMTM